MESKLENKILNAFIGKVVRKDLAFLVKGGLPVPTHTTTEDHTEEPKTKRPRIPVLQEKSMSFRMGQTGVSYEKLFAPYMREAKEITVEDPYTCFMANQEFHGVCSDAYQYTSSG